jgi:MYXO-CTERM domain-containing protein
MIARLGWGVGLLGVVGFVAATSSSGAAQAHFILEVPAAKTEQDALGNPQKTPPCGDPGATGPVTTFQAGETITVTIDETIFHPGHYRVALAVNDVSELPDAPPVTPGASDCGSTIIQDPPIFPVLADGELVHDAAFGGPQSFEVTLPDDVECDNCTLQIIEFMSSHGAPCYYYHCAAIAIEGSGNPTYDGTDGSSADGDPSTTGDGESSTTGPDPTAGNSTRGPGTTANATVGDTGPGSATESGTDSGVEQDAGDDEGCACAASRNDAPGHLATVFGLLGLLGLRLRSR